MPLPAPDLDNRAFADIVAEARALVPRYTAEWTDLNESDPGVTLVELFAWMTEMVIYRLNQVPDLSYVKFLELIGITLRPAEPARAELTFTLVDPPTAAVVSIPKATRVAAAGGDGGPVVFETDAGLNALGPRLATVLSYDGFGYTDVTAANGTAGQTYAPFGPQARDGSALLLGFDFAQPFPDVQVNLAFFAAPVGLPAEGVHCDMSLAEIVPPSLLVWEAWDGLQWLRLPLDGDETLALTRSGHVYLQVHGSQLQKLALAGGTTACYWIRCRVQKGGYDRAPMLFAALTNTVAATQALTVENEVLGATDGMPGQSFQTYYAPVVDATLALEIDEGDGWRAWQVVADFLGSGPDDLHVTLDRATGTVTTGDGVQGHAPAANPLNPAGNVVARRYRYGGGRAGTLPPGSITQLQTALDGVTGVANLRASEGGADEETLDQAKARAPQELKSRNRAVTAEDFQYLARVTPGVSVARAECLPLTDPAFPGVEVPGAVTVVVLPDVAGPAPTPTEATLETVCRHLGKHRLLTTEVHVVGPIYRRVSVQAQIRALPSADLGAVRRAVDAALTGYFHPLTGGDDGAGWPLGGEIFYSLVYKTVMTTPGVGRIDLLNIELDGERQPFCQDVPIADPRLGPQVLLDPVGNDISVSYP
jgi:predicted phage baseplate assembly protein